MPRYFFHTEDGQRISDDEGVELIDDLAAKQAAIRMLGELSHDEQLVLASGTLRIVVTDAAGAVILSVSASITLTPIFSPRVAANL